MDKPKHKPKTLIENLLDINKISSDQKVFIFALIKEEHMRNERHQIIKAVFGVAQTYQVALQAIYEGHHYLKEYRVADWMSIDLGPNPSTPTLDKEAFSSLPIARQEENPPKENPPKVDPPKVDPPKENKKNPNNVENIIGLLIDDFTENEMQKDMLRQILKKIKQKKHDR